MAFSILATGFFAGRNTGRAKNEPGRVPVALGQYKTVFDEIKAYDKTIAKGTESAINLVREASGNKEALKGIRKILGFCSENVNPLICVSSLVQVARAEDQKEEAVIQAGTLGFMFTGEALCKEYYEKVANSAPVKDSIKKLSESKAFNKAFNIIETHNLGGKIGEIVKAATFLTCSIGSSTIGNKIGHAIADKLDEKKEISLFKDDTSNGSLRMAA